MLSLAIVYPWIGHGWFLALDWVHGPVSRLPPRAGIDAVGQASLPITAVLYAAGRVLGTALLSWVTVAASIVLGAISAWEITPGRSKAKGVAALLYVVNPFVFDRIYAGQVFFLLGYALLPLAIRAIVTGVTRARTRLWLPAVWITAEGALSVHFLWICGVALVAVLVAYRSRAVALSLGLTVIALIGLNAYLVVPDLLQHSNVIVSGNDLAAFRTSSYPSVGLYLNVLALYGFWRLGPISPRAYVAAWPLIWAVVLLVALRGIAVTVRAGDRSGVLAPLAISGVAGYFLALGSQGPTGSVFRLLYVHVPGFAVMREPQKFLCLFVLACAVGFGVGVESLAARLPRTGGRAAVAVGALAVLAYTPNIFGGLGGQISLSHYPKEWAVANKIMGDGPGAALVLPLHEYMAFYFTGGRVVANPAPEIFDRQTLIGAQVEAGPLITNSASPEDAYLEELVTHGPEIHDLGHLLSQLGVAYIVLDKTADYQSYQWVAKQTDLSVAYRGRSLTVYRNLAPIMPHGVQLETASSVPSLDCYLQLSNRYDLSGVAVTIRPGTGCVPPARPQPPTYDVRRRSLVSFSALSRGSGYLVVPEPGDGSWVSNHSTGRVLVNGLQAFHVGVGPVHVTYRRWWAPSVGDAVSMLLLTGMAISLRRSKRAERNLQMDADGASGACAPARSPAARPGM